MRAGADREQLWYCSSESTHQHAADRWGQQAEVCFVSTDWWLDAVELCKLRLQSYTRVLFGLLLWKVCRERDRQIDHMYVCFFMGKKLTRKSLWCKCLIQNLLHVEAEVCTERLMRVKSEDSAMALCPLPVKLQRLPNIKIWSGITMRQCSTCKLTPGTLSANSWNFPVPRKIAWPPN